MKFIYQVPPIIPKGKDEEWKPGYYGFMAHLDTGFAVDARGTLMNESAHEILQKDARKIIKSFKMKGMFERDTPYCFLAGSWLLQYVVVPGDATDLGLSHVEDFGCDWHSFAGYAKELRRKGESLGGICYVPHNVDTHQQASVLSALWLNWANTANAVLSK